MYINKCSKCGAEFETKNPKRVICPTCLYPDKNPINLKSFSETISQKPETTPETNHEHSVENNNSREQGEFKKTFNNEIRKPYDNNFNNNQNTGYRRPPFQQQGGQQQGGFRRPPFQQQGDHQQGGFRRPPFQQQGDHQQGGFRRPPFQQQGDHQQGGFRRPPFLQQGGYQQGGFRRPPQRGGVRPKKSLLVSREQVAEIESLYKPLLPLPNPDVHEIIGAKIQLEPHKVFFGINLVRQKLNLSKLPFPKRKLAVSPEQLSAIQMLYEPLLPLPPIGCHKILAKQLKMDEWRVHVGIGIVRKQLELPRWNTEREDIPEEFKNKDITKAE